jgi:hypothetical protein
VVCGAFEGIEELATPLQEEYLEAASRIAPRRLMHGRWAWPKGELEIQRDLLLSAPPHGIDQIKLRGTLAQLDDRAGDRLIEMMLDSGLLEGFTVPLDNGLPQPDEVSLRALRRIRKADAKLRRDLAGNSDGDIATARLPEVPRANLQSHFGSLGEAYSPRRPMKAIRSSDSA